jgi:hypothetical protein
MTSALSDEPWKQDRASKAAATPRLTSRERILCACAHQEPDKLPVDFGGGFQTGMHVSIVYKLRQALGLDRPGTPVKVVEVYQMLGEIAPDLREALGIDTVNVGGTGTMFGFPQKDFKEWVLADGTPVLVPGGFNTQYEPNGDLLQWPENDRSVPPSGRMPAGGHFFDAIIRQEPLVEDRLDPADNTEEFQPVSDAELEHYRRLAEHLERTTDKALFCTFGGLTFGDIALVPATFLKRPKGIRDIEEWYVSTVSRPAYVHAVFERQTEGRCETWSGCMRRWGIGSRCSNQRHGFRDPIRALLQRVQVPGVCTCPTAAHQWLDSPPHEMEDVHALLRRHGPAAGRHRRSRV